MNITYNEFCVLYYMKVVNRNISLFDARFLATKPSKRSLGLIMSNLKRKGLVETCWEMILGNPKPVFMGWELTEKSKDIDFLKNNPPTVYFPNNRKRSN